MKKTLRLHFYVFIAFCLVAALNSVALAQKSRARKAQPQNLPKVTVINGEELVALAKANGKPLLINFWATWCDPCREEFPDLVKIDADYAGKIDFFTVSLDDFDDLTAAVPKFLSSVNAKMPSYLLRTPDEDKAIQSISTNWEGGLPFTILIGTDGTAVYQRTAKVNPAILRQKIDLALNGENSKK